MNSTALKILDSIIFLRKTWNWLTIHDQNQLPSFGFTERTADESFEYTKTKVIRLYENSNNGIMFRILFRRKIRILQK